MSMKSTARRPLRHTLLGLTVSLAMGASPALAQEMGGDTGGGTTTGNNNGLLTTVGATASTTSAGVGIGVVITVRKRKAAQRPPSREDQRRELRRQQMRILLTHDAPAMQQAVAMGAGDSAAPIAYLFNVDDAHQARFMAVLRTHHNTLLPLLDAEHASDERMEQLLTRVEALMAQDETLAPLLHELIVWERG